MCDVYVYENCYDGWTTHVARRRKVIPPIPDLLLSDFSMSVNRWSKCELHKTTRKMVYPIWWREIIYRAWTRFAMFWHNHIHGLTLSIIPAKPIGLPHDGEDFDDDTPDECADRLEHLRALGYRVPQYAIDALREEAKEEKP